MSKYILFSNGDFVSSNELYHWGIKGMKWGIRRFQNKDGSLTALGKKRSTQSQEYHSKQKELDTRHSSEKSRRSGLTEAQTIDELKKLTEPTRNRKIREDSESMQKWRELDQEIKDYSGDWYLSKGVSQGFKNTVDQHKQNLQLTVRPKQDEARQLRRKYNDLVDEIAVNNLPNSEREYTKKTGMLMNQENYRSAFESAQKHPDALKAKTEYKIAELDAKRVESKENKRYESELCGVVLKDLGYKDTPEGRELIKDTVINDR